MPGVLARLPPRTSAHVLGPAPPRATARVSAAPGAAGPPRPSPSTSGSRQTRGTLGMMPVPLDTGPAVSPQGPELAREGLAQSHIFPRRKGLMWKRHPRVPADSLLRLFALTGTVAGGRRPRGGALSLAYLFVDCAEYRAHPRHTWTAPSLAACPGHRGTVSSIPGLCPPEARSTHQS